MVEKKKVSYEQAFWQQRVNAAFRTGWACLMAGVIMQFHGKWVAFPVFAYVTAITVVGEASLGEALKSAFSVLIGTLVGALPTIGPLWLITTANYSLWVATLSVLFSTFVIGYTSCLDVVAKRVAFAQIVIIYISAHIYEHVDAIMYPLRITGVTALGCGCAVVALIIPVPKVACYEVQEKSKLAARITSEVLRYLVSSFAEEDNKAAASLRLQANTLINTGDIILKQVEDRQVVLKWELLGMRTFKSPVTSKEFNKLKKTLIGMEMALQKSSSSLDPTFRLRVQYEVVYVAEWAALALKHTASKNMTPQVRARLVAEGKEAMTSMEDALAITIQEIYVHDSSNNIDLLHNLKPKMAALFLAFQMKTLAKHTLNMIDPPHQNRTSSAPLPPTSPTTMTININATSSKNKVVYFWKKYILKNPQLKTALKCSLSLALSVLFGVMYGHTRGYWASIAVAISMGFSREATFKLANVRAQGTVAGSVYGVLATVLTEEYMVLRAVALVPWVIFSSFLRQSEMYGYAGGLSAFIAAIIILGKRDEDPPPAFAIMRITETFIGLACYVFVELLLDGKRACTLARSHLSVAINQAHKLTLSLTSSQTSEQDPALVMSTLNQSHKILKSNLSQLKSYIEEAKSEPDFWFLPFPTPTYTKIQSSLLTISDLLYFCIQCHEFVIETCTASETLDTSLFYEFLTNDITIFQYRVCSSLKCLSDILQTKSLGKILLKSQQTLNEEETATIHPESPPKEGPEHHSINIESCEDNFGVEPDFSLGSLTENVSQAMKHLKNDSDSSSVFAIGVALSSIGFSMDILVKEVEKLEGFVQELLQWENPWSLIDLRTIHQLNHVLDN